MVLCAYTCFSQAPKNLQHYIEASNLVVIGQVIQVMPDILQDDLGTAYGSLSAKCFNAFDPKSIKQTKCPTDTLYSLIYLSTEGNKPNIELNKQDFCLLFLISEKFEENQFNPIYKLTNENAIFILKPEIIKQLIAIHPNFKEINLYDFIH